MSQDISKSVRTFISENFLFREDLESFPDDASFLEAGIIDSTGVLELISFLESNFGIEVLDDEMVPENFDSVSRIVAYLKRKVGEQQDECAFVAPIPSYAG